MMMSARLGVAKILLGGGMVFWKIYDKLMNDMAVARRTLNHHQHYFPGLVAGPVCLFVSLINFGMFGRRKKKVHVIHVPV